VNKSELQGCEALQSTYAGVKEIHAIDIRSHIAQQARGLFCTETRWGWGHIRGSPAPKP